MSQTNTDIQLKRTKNTLEETKNIELLFAEPFFVDNTIHDTEGNIVSPVKAYLVMGRQADNEEVVTVKKSPVFKALNQNIADNMVFHNAADGSITNEAGEQIPANRLTVIDKNISDLKAEDLHQYYILCQTSDDNVVYKFTLDELGVSINGRGITQGVAWNDYAETRPLFGDAEPGDIVCDIGGGAVQKSKEKYQVCPHVVTDTYGQLIGENDEDTIPIAVAGRVQVKVNNSNLKIGDCICAGANGIGEKMTRQEITNYPDRIVGVVCEITNSNKVWVNVK